MEGKVRNLGVAQAGRSARRGCHRIVEGLNGDGAARGEAGSRPPAGATRLFLEQVGVGTGTDHVQLATVDLIDHEPVRFDMRLPVALPDSSQRMIAMTRGQGFPLDQGCQQRPSLSMSLPRALAFLTSRFGEWRG